MGWQGAPRAGEVWRRRRGGKQETRRVYDRTFGGDVCYTSGRGYRYQCSGSEWHEWAAGAKLIAEAPTIPPVEEVALLRPLLLTDPFIREDSDGNMWCAFCSGCDRHGHDEDCPWKKASDALKGGA